MRWELSALPTASISPNPPSSATRAAFASFTPAYRTADSPATKAPKALTASIALAATITLGVFAAADGAITSIYCHLIASTVH